MKPHYLALFLLCTTTLVLAQTNPVPLINQPLVPASAAPGGPGFNLVVNGTGFSAASVVEWNGRSLITTVVSGQKLIAKVPASRISKAGTASVRVANPGVASSNVVLFPVAASESAVAFSRTDIDDPTPTIVFSADFNNDQRADLLVGDGNGVSLFLGKGNGSFNSPLVTLTDGLTLVTGDFNNSGNLGFAYLDVYLGNGEGTFTFGSSFNDQEEGGLVTGDFNGDGKLDVVLFNVSFGSIGAQVSLGNGDGTFTATGPSFGTNAETATVADFNGDGKLDLAVPSYQGNTVSIFLGNGDGTFQSPMSATAPSAQRLTTADFNGDGILDLAVPAGSSGIAVLLGNGDGSFKPYVTYPTASNSVQTVTGDFNGDGKLDLAALCVTTESGTGFVSLLLGNGDGSFQTHVDFATGIYPDGMDLGDFNNDGRLDLAVANYFGNSLSIFLQSTVSLSPISLTFPAQNVGSTSSPQNLTLTNSGNTAITINSITFTGANATDFSQTNTCGTSLAGGTSCAIAVTFTPTATGTRTATINVNDNAVGSPQTAALSGTGTAPAVTLSTNNLTFATQLLRTTSSAQQVTVTNTGTGTLNITSIVGTGDFTQTNTCGSSVQPGASCTISVQFMPTQKGTRTGSVTIMDNAPDNPQTISLTGCGTVVKLSAIGLNFGNQKVGTTSPPVIVTVTNVSGQTLSLSSISITGTDPGDFAQTNTCGTGIAGHASCKIRVTFTPTMQGSRNATLSISDNGGCSPQTVALSGNGT
ncbi:MAG: choice-of-anchor D domain-containing protein [Acidobacteriia bacterium]|nr:choice-of-anchor D domain-containing protein [Terriglobia bacterium]